jgi:hypothetical protein
MRLRDTARVIAVVIASVPALAQQVAPEGRVYVFHSKPAGQCPALDWHVVVGPDNKLSGMVAWNNMQNMANVTGTINPDRTFSMTGNAIDPVKPWPMASCPPRCPPEGQEQTAVIFGTLKADGRLTANIRGPNFDCQGIEVPWFVPPPSGGAG